MASSHIESYRSIPIGIPLSQYTAAITNTVATATHLMGVWLIAELSDVRSSGGHCYMELIEKNESGQTIAKLRANIWRNNFIQLQHKFFNATQKNISTGIKALVRGSVNHHPLYGLSFNIIDIDPSYTIGDLERLRREIILKLQKEGLYHKNKELPLPVAPQRIAIISAEGAAGYGDFMNQLMGNSEGFVFYTHLFPCVMQGDKVSESIRKALAFIEATADLWDCVVIIRGGGATTDLNGFDDYDLAKAVATCGLPVVVGIGHERDRNVLDEIANTSLKTPTAVAGFFIDRLREAYEYILSLTDKLQGYSNELMRGEERRLSTIQTFIPQLALRRLQDAKARLQSITGRLPLLTEGRIGKENVKLDSFKNIFTNLSSSKISKETLKIENLLTLCTNVSSTCLEHAKQKINNYESIIKVLDPKNTLLRGYSITRINGKALKSVEKINRGDTIVTTLPDGEVTSSVL